MAAYPTGHVANCQTGAGEGFCSYARSHQISNRCILVVHVVASCRPVLQDVLAAIRQRLEKAVATMHIPQWPQSATAVSPQATNFQARLFGRALRLLHNCTLFDGVLPRRSVQS